MRISDWSSDVCSSDLPEMSGGDGEATVIEQWGRVRGRLRTEVGEAAYRSWLKPLTLAGSRNGRLRLAVPTRFMRDWGASNYASRLFALWRSEERRVGKGWVSKCMSRWLPCQSK